MTGNNWERILWLVPVIIGGLYILAGIAGFITGGPRQGKGAGSPRLYDNTYFLLRIIFGTTLAGLGFAFKGMTGSVASAEAVDLFVRSSGTVLMALCLPALVRGSMKDHAAKYLVKYGPWATRWLHRQHILRSEYWGKRFEKFSATLVGVLGAMLLIFGSGIYDLPIAVFLSKL